MLNRTCLVAGAAACALSLTIASGVNAESPVNPVLSFEAALAARDYEGAMNHAAAGCTERRDFASCRRLASLPIHIGNSGARVPQSLALRLKTVAAAACRSPEPYRDIVGSDVTARECAHLARRFVLARDPEYRTALAPETARFFASIYDPSRAAALRRAGPRSAVHATIVSRAALHDTLELLEQETGPGTRAALEVLTCQDPMLPSYSELEKACNPTLVLHPSFEPALTR